MTHIIIGSINPMKFEATEEALGKYFNISFIVGKDTSSDISEQPKSFLEMMIGSQNRAKKAYQPECDLSVGLESGYDKLEGIGAVNFCVGTLYDGKQIYQGISPGFFVPDNIIEEIETQDVDMSQAIHNLGISKDKKVGYGEGYIGIMTKGVSSRKEYMKQAIHMAMIQYYNKNPQEFSKNKIKNEPTSIWDSKQVTIEKIPLNYKPEKSDTHEEYGPINMDESDDEGVFFNGPKIK